MSVARRLLRPLAATLAVAVGATASGCGGGGWYGPSDVGTLEVVNSPGSFEVIETIEISQPYGPVEVYHVDLFPGDAFEIDLYEDFYDVAAWWSDGWVDEFVVEIDEDDTTTVVLTD